MNPDPTLSAPKPCSRATTLLGGSICAAIAAIVLFARAVTAHFNHDENQFLAAGSLIAKHGLLPFRDYAYFHAPGQPFLLAMLFTMTDHLLLAGRALSVAGGIAIAVMLFVTASRRGLFIAIAAVVIFVFNPMTAYTASLSWNHSLPVCCTLAAFLLLDKPTGRSAFAAGVFAGAAVLFRHSYPPVVVALAIYLAIKQSDNRRRHVALFFVGAAVAMIPFVFFPARQLYFGLVTYPSLSKQYWANQPIHLPRTISEKIGYLVHANINGAAPAALLFTSLGAVIGAWWFCRGNVERDRIVGLLLVLGALLIGMLAPTPTMQQYPFAAVPFLILLMVEARPRLGAARYVIVLPLLAALWAGRADLAELRNLGHPTAWVPLQIHRVSRRIPASTPTPIFTLAPIFPLESGLDIDPACATGPFAYRIARQLSSNDRARFSIVGPDEWWSRDIGSVILGDRNTEGIVESVESHGYQRVQDQNAWSLWRKVDETPRERGR